MSNPRVTISYTQLKGSSNEYPRLEAYVKGVVGAFAKDKRILPWDSWQKPYVDREPSIWFHEIFRQDGTPYRNEEVELIRKLTGVAC